MGISFTKLGDVYYQAGDWENALLNYQERNKIAKEICEKIPENLSYKYGLSVSYERLGRNYEQKGDWKNALYNYQENFRIIKEIYESSPEKLEYKNSIAISYQRLAGVFINEKSVEDGVKNFLLAINIFKEIVTATQGKIIYYVYNFSWNCDRVSNIIKDHSLFQLLDKAKVKALRQEGYQAIKPLAEQGLLQEKEKKLFTKLSDESWYIF